MAAGTQQSRVTAGWSDDVLDLRIDVDEAGMARLTRLTARHAARSKPAPGEGAIEPAVSEPGGYGAGIILADTAGTPGRDRDGLTPADAALPLLDVVLAGEGKAWSGGRYCESEAGGRFRYTGHDDGSTAPADAIWRELRIDLSDPVSGLRAEVFYRILIGQGALRSWVRLTNRGTRPVTVESVTSFLWGGLSSGALTPATARAAGPAAHVPASPDDLGHLDVLWAENDWLAEARWQRRALRDALPDLNRQVHGADPRGRFGLTSTGSWSSGRYLPMGAVVSRRSGHAWAWQIEHNGGWHWQVGECTHRPAAEDPGGRHARRGSVTGAYVAMLGPADTEHQWRVTLAPGDTFSTVPAAVVVSAAGFEGAIASLTACRRAARRPHQDHRRLPVIFNDYMNTLMGNPTTERLLPLISAAAQAGTEYFCIDAGWYADIGEGWWDTVGAWKPSETRFSNGITEVLDQIRAAGMIPGLWLEPEVVGVHSPVTQQLPPEAFFQRGGSLVIEHGRLHLDLRHPAAVKHLDEVVDFVVGDLGAGYLKLDYNIAVCPGTDAGNLSPGAGLLAANRAHLDWLDRVLDRHPGLVIENCASGGMRIDYALLSRLQIQSTSDQQDYFRYPPVAAAAPTAMTPEQAAVWAYPQPDFTGEEITFTLCGSLLGRVHLSGHLDQMSPAQRELVAAAVRVYKSIRADLPAAVPFWPLGLPRWTDSWIALGMRGPGASYLTVWHRGAFGTGGNGPAEATLPVPHLRGLPVTAEVLYPEQGSAGVNWDPAQGTLVVTLPRTPTACLLRLVP